MNIKYRPSTAEDQQLLKFPGEFVGCNISIFWDGDNVFYPCTVVRYDTETDKFAVRYVNDETNEESIEDLQTSKWQVGAQCYGRFEGKYRNPSVAENTPGAILDGANIEVFWDGDAAFYGATIVRYDASSKSYGVVYDEDTNETVEELHGMRWRFWAGTDAELLEFKAAKKVRTVRYWVK
jgi:hypothetical protein